MQAARHSYTILPTHPPAAQHDQYDPHRPYPQNLPLQPPPPPTFLLPPFSSQPQPDPFYPPRPPHSHSHHTYHHHPPPPPPLQYWSTSNSNSAFPRSERDPYYASSREDAYPVSPPSAAPAPASTMSTTTTRRRPAATTTSTTTLPSHNVSWKVEHRPSRNGRLQEVIVLDDSPEPPTSPPQTAVAPPPPRGTKRARDAPAAPSSSFLVPSASSSASKRRKREPQQPAGYGYQTGTVGEGSSKAYAGSEYGGSSTRGSYASQPSAKAAAPVPCDDKEGHYIVVPNENLSSRYKIVKLLGQGTFGKVVEAYDRVQHRHVAIKIIRAIQKYRDASKIEIRVLDTLRENDPPNRNKCIHMLEWFDHRNHICVVTELLGMSVFDFLKDNKFCPFPANHIQSFARQLLHSVAFLHRLRLIHTDLKPENILLVDAGSRMQPATHTRPQRRLLENTEIRLIDFGSATFEDEYHSSVVSTRHYRAPEIILGLGWSFPCDVFSLGCIFVEFFTGEALFQTHDNLEHLAMMEAVLGKMPDRFAKSAARSKPEFFRGSKLDYPNASASKQARKYVKNMRSLEAIIGQRDVTHARLLDLLRKMLHFDPGQRISVDEALRHPYFMLNIQPEV